MPETTADSTAPNNRLVIHDTIYDITPAYRQGALDARKNVPHFCNPYREDSQDGWDWDAGHTQEFANEHTRFGIDVITAPPTGREFEMDPDIPQDAHGNAMYVPPWRTE